MARANSSLPMPDSPKISTVASRTVWQPPVHLNIVCQCKGSSLESSTRVACVPIYFTGHVHYDCQDNKERDGAHEQRVILLPQSDVEKQVHTCQSGADHECAHAASQEKPAIPCDQQHRCHRRDQVSPTES